MMPLFSDGAISGLIPVPLHPAKCRERGYNQSEYICQGIHAVTGLRVITGLLKRQRYTESQTHLEIEERRKNVAGAFVLDPSAEVSGRTFLIVDDVITTGATMSACAKTLGDHGAGIVIACSVALAE
jgi:ComF family protein